MKGYSGMYILKAAIENAGKVEQKAAAAEIRNGKTVVAETLPPLNKK